jgi:electron transfer flavoprotein alpha/beta subunit
VNRVVFHGRKVTIRRVSDDGYQVVMAEHRAVVSAVEKINKPRYPSCKG